MRLISLSMGGGLMVCIREHDKEGLLISTHNLFLYGKIRKNLLKLPLNSLCPE